MTIDAENHKDNKKNAVVKYGKLGHKVEFCIDGDQCNQLMRMKFNRLFEVDANGTEVGNKAQNFNVAEYIWTPSEYTMDENGTNVSTRVRKSKILCMQISRCSQKSFTKTLKWSMGMKRYSRTTEPSNFPSTSQIGRGKMAPRKTAWVLGLNSKSKRKEERTLQTIQSEQSTQKATNVEVERMDLGDGMFMDSPSNCIIDYEVLDNVTTSIEPATTDDGISIDWIFPYFEKNLYYDPMMGDNSEVDGDEEGDEDSNTGSKSTFANFFIIKSAVSKWRL